MSGFGAGAGGIVTTVFVLSSPPVQPADECHLAVLSPLPTQPILNLCWHGEVHSLHLSDSLGSRPTQLVNCWRHVPGWTALSAGDFLGSDQQASSQALPGTVQVVGYLP